MTQPFIGCTISLISKSDIGYIGTLVNVETVKQELTLQSVRSLGTQGRREPAVGPSTDVYDFVTFRRVAARV